jgi:hypothetical protein
VVKPTPAHSKEVVVDGHAGKYFENAIDDCGYLTGSATFKYRIVDGVAECVIAGGKQPRHVAT